MRTRPDVITQLSLPSGPVDLDEGGYLRDPDNWSPDFARHMADKMQINLTKTHWDILNFMRDYNDMNGISADSRFVIKFLGKRNDLDKSTARRLLFTLFPYGYVGQAVKMAGMKQPRAWSTG